MTTLGTPAGPFFMGFVTKHIGVEWIYWIYAIINFVQFLAYLAIGAETVYVPEQKNSPTKPRNAIVRALVPRRINPRPLELKEFVAPLFVARFPRVLIPALGLAVAFCYGNIAIVVEMPTAFGGKFNFDPQQIGLQFIAIMIGCFLGEQVGGPISDWFLKFLSARKGARYPADRLWLSYIGHATVIAGLLTWGFQLQNAKKWNVTPDVGAAIASFGTQLLVTTLTAFAVDCHREESTNVGVFINICRQIYGFVSQLLPHVVCPTNDPRLAHSISNPCFMYWAWEEQLGCSVPLLQAHHLFLFSLYTSLHVARPFKPWLCTFCITISIRSSRFILGFRHRKKKTNTYLISSRLDYYYLPC